MRYTKIDKPKKVLPEDRRFIMQTIDNHINTLKSMFYSKINLTISLCAIAFSLIAILVAMKISNAIYYIFLVFIIYIITVIALFKKDKSVKLVKDLSSFYSKVRDEHFKYLKKK